MIKRGFLLQVFFLTVISCSLKSQDLVPSPSSEKKGFMLGQFSLGYGYYLNGGALLSTGFEYKMGKVLSPKWSLGGGIAYTQFKPLDGLYGISLLSELRYFLRDESKNWRFSGVADVGIGIGGSRLQTGWGSNGLGPRFYSGASISRKLQNNMSLMLEIGYLYQNLSYKDNTPGRGWQIFQTESIMKYHFRRIQIKTGLFF
jgi:hypothetical protein